MIQLRYILIAFTLISVLVQFAGCATAPHKDRSADDASLLSLEEQWGIRVLNIRVSAGGYMLDFRYKVLDAEKAAPLFDRRIKPYLIDQATGASFAVPEPPKVGALRQTRKPVADRNYFIIFANPGKYVKQGDKVTVVIGDFRAGDLVVE